MERRKDLNIYPPFFDMNWTLRHISPANIIKIINIILIIYNHIIYPSISNRYMYYI